MILHSIPVLTATLVVCITPVLAQSLPYNPTYLVQGQDSKVYQFSPSTTPQFAVYDVTNGLKNTDAPEPITSQLPFLSDASNSFVPLATREGLSVFSGECSDGEQELDLWSYGFGANNRTWTQVKTTSSDAGLSANFLAAGFAFPSTTTASTDSLYVFGGMCASSTSNSSTWTTDATYSNTMLTISPEQGADFEVSLTGTRSPPIAEAGLSITPLIPASVGADNTTQQQNFVLIGGHTQNAFINMSQLAMFSMPEQAWAFIGINQPASTVVEPRSGHSAVITADGSKIIVFGGWVGDITNPATPSLAILEVGAGYGGNDSWAWTVPDVKQPYTGGGAGLYGHAAIMLPGDVMMVTGGYSITSAARRKTRRDTPGTMFFNISASSWTSTYTNLVTHARTQPSHSSMSSTSKTGLGLGLGLGIAILALIVVVWLLWSRRKREQRRLREKELREMALGTNDGRSTVEISRVGSPAGVFPSYRSASWAARQEQQIEGFGHATDSIRSVDEKDDINSRFESTRNEIFDVSGPHPRISNRLLSRGPPGIANRYIPPPQPQGVFTIEEVEERSERGSFQKPPSTISRPQSDPFKDPPQEELPQSQVDEAAEKRKKEVETWVDDWQTAAESMSMSRSPSKATIHARTYSNLSILQSSSSSSGDRTRSDLSDKSNISDLSRHQPGSGTVSRQMSQKSGSAGYALFAGAAAAMGRLAGRQDHAGNGIERSASKRAVSTGDLNQMGARKRSGSVEQSNQPLVSPRSREELNVAGTYFTPPESPIKDYKNHVRKRSSSFGSHSHSNSLTSQSRRALGALSIGAKRILTGTGTVSVLDKVSTIETQSRESSPTKGSPTRPGLEVTEASPRQVSSGTEFWKHKRGAKDWDDNTQLGESSGTVRRRSGRPIRFEDDEREADNKQDEDWDPEAAINQRVVQVMFTVPKERLRVVNADNLSLLSRSDTHASRDSNRSEDVKEKEKELNRMSRVTERDGETEDTEDGSTTLMGSGLDPESAFPDLKGKEKILLAGLRPKNSGETIGKAI